MADYTNLESGGNLRGEGKPQQNVGGGKAREKPKPNLGPSIARWLPWWSQMDSEAETFRKKINCIQLLTGGNQYKKHDCNKNPDLERVFAKGKRRNVNVDMTKECSRVCANLTLRSALSTPF